MWGVIVTSHLKLGESQLQPQENYTKQPAKGDKFYNWYWQELGFGGKLGHKSSSHKLLNKKK